MKVKKTLTETFNVLRDVYDDDVRFTQSTLIT